MATSGTFTGSRGGNTYGPWLELDWARQQIDIPNNRSLIRLTLRLHASTTLKFSAGKSGNLHGSSFTYTGGFSGTGSKVLRTRDIWVNHNEDGSKSQSFSASFNIAVSWGGSHLSSLSVSGVASITSIPRASTLSAFSFASNLKPSTAVTLNYMIDRKSDAFRHQVQLRDGSYVVQTWDNVSSDGASTVSLSTASVNNLLNRMSNVTSRSLTLRVATRSGVGGGWIGSAVTINATASVDATIKPAVSALTVSQTGNSVSTHYLQGKSKVKANFTINSAGYGATTKSSSITVRRKTTENDVQTIKSNNGTTDKVVSLTGTYEARGMATDSRGRTTYTAWAEFTVTAYNSPRITNFTADRSTATPTTVSISRAGTHTHLGGSNVLTYTVERRIGTGSWTNVTTNATGTSNTASFTGTSSSTGNSVTSSYDFRMVITDKFEESAESIVSVSTQRVVLDIHKNEGVGIGKIHELGVLDVDGEAHFRGNLVVQPTDARPSLELHSYDPNGHAYIEYFGNDGNRKGYVGFPTPSNNFFTIANERTDGDIRFLPNTGRIRVNWDDVVGSGSANNGHWIRFYDGTQICYGQYVNLTYANTSALNARITMPANFANSTYSVVLGMRYSDAHYARGQLFYENVYTSRFDILWRISPNDSTKVGTGWSARADWMAIGRWK